jgi:molecular chaperone HtpG
VFLRELVSNSADALDKLRYEALSNDSLMGEDDTLAITLRLDKDAGTLTVADNGIGMSHDELIENLGTIARSGTKAFIEKVKADKDKQAGEPDLIGQFGVGFYSSFMVADRVDVVSHRAGTQEAWRWSSDGKGSFDLTAADEDAPRGTIITLHLKQDAREFLEENEIRRIIHTYSDHISFPILLEGAAKPGDGEDADTEDATQQLNEANALWTRPKSDITPEQYKEFYHHTGGMFDEPAITLHYTAEGRQLFTSLLFVPTMPPFDLFDPARSGHVRLYVKRVFITDNADLLPSYLRFVRGIVDSEDIPLNISREMLQNNPLLAAIRKAVTNKLLSELVKTSEKDAEKYLSIWQNFGPVIKEGLYEDPERRDTLFKLVRFKTTKSDAPVESTDDDGETSAASGWRSLADYVADMPEQQKAIYYITGDNMEQIQASPQLEGYQARGLEVLLLTDPVDSFWVTTAVGFDGKSFQSITQGDASLDDMPLKDEDDKPSEETTETSDALIERLKTVLADDVMDVTKSTRLVSSPACLIAAQHGPDRQMEKLMARQQGGTGGGKPVLEINTGHALAKALNQSIEQNKDERFNDLAFVLLDEARILEGGAPADPAKFTDRLNRLLLG